jgi:phosphocarrier protein FPr
MEVELVIQNRTGLHARPAREFVNLAKTFQADVRVQHGAKKANGKSLVSLLTLGVKRGSTIRLEVQGADEAAALAALTAAVHAGLGEGTGEGEAASAPAVPRPAHEEKPGSGSFTGSGASPRAEDPRLRRGIPASPGLAVGPIHQLRAPQAAVAPELVAGSAAEERARLEAALSAARKELGEIRDRLVHRAGAAEAAIFDVHVEILDDPEIVSAALARVEQGDPAHRAWKATLDGRAAVVAKLEDALLAARAADLTDVAERVLRLLGAGPALAPLPDHPVIVVAPELSPSQTSAFEAGRVLGVCTAAGGPTSHAAILARALGIPSVVGAGPDVLGWPEGAPVVLDGEAGTVLRDPDAAERARAEVELAARAERRRVEVAGSAGPAVTADGHRVEVVANVGSAAEARQAAAAGAEGVGLLRTEFLFQGRAAPPSEDEQRAAYAAVAVALGGKPVIVRTLDVGGDKPLAYLPMPPEANPFLGVRGLRLCLARPELLREQLRAIVRASRAGTLRVMFPMVADAGELRAARAMLAEVTAEAKVPALEVGIMVEIPAAALLADSLAREVDFFSIGSNDLTQYTLAMDRGHPTLATQADGLHPAVLRLIERTVQGAHAAGKWVGLCGELGADPAAVPILVGLGLDELSVNVPAVPAVKARIRALSYEQARAVAARALSCATAAEVREKAVLR